MLTQPNQPREEECVGVDSVEGTAFSIEDTGADTNSKIDDLIGIAAEVKRALNKRLIIVTAAIMVPLFVGALFLIALLAQADEVKDITTSTNANSLDIQAVLNTLNNATGPEAQKRNAASTIDILRRNAIETDCRTRRIFAGLPAPDSTQPCDVQTPASVFPG
jgi:hypothetical protein